MLDGNCYVETANIDGETNLKLRIGKKELSDFLQDGKLGDQVVAMERVINTDMKVVADAPNDSINSFTATATIDGKNYPMDSSQFLHRGSVLRNTNWAIGLSVYTGHQTKIALNSADPPVKRSTIDKIVDRMLYIVVFAQIILVSAATIGYVIATSSMIYFKDDLGYYSTWYLIPKGKSAEGFIFPSWLAYWFSYFILFNNFVPINLYVTLDIINLLQGLFINSDLAMYSEDSDTPSNCRASNLCQDIGMVEYIFSDKTGTLTQNVMKLKKIAIGKDMYGNEEGLDFNDESLSKLLQTGESKQAEDFMVILAVAHTVVTDKQGVYQAESPDEAALVDGASIAGIKFVGRRGEVVEIKCEWETKSREYVIEAINSFNSKRKRMSVVVRRSDGSRVLMIKGADNVIFDRQESKGEKKIINSHLDTYAQKGLRTLLVGQREITEEEFKIWKKKYDKACAAIGKQRKTLLAEVAEEIEKDINILGVTAIEDKLQDGVEDTISNLADAGIKLWVLTGDKVETAINIGYSCKVLVPGMKLVLLVETSPDQINFRLENLVCQLRQIQADGKDVKTGQAEIGPIHLKNMALIIHGKTLEHIMSHSIRKDMLLELAIACKVVLACRVSPLQKSKMVELVRLGIKPEPITLAIGDGANDVTMIQSAHVGVGISGKEGQQAANVSDFSISQFRYLQRLLLVHGRWNYRRICKAITYVFYKNFALTLTLLYYAAVTGFSGTSIYDSWVYVSFNVHTMLPICAVGTLDQDVRAETVEKFPALYMTGRLNLDLNPKVIFQYILLAFVHSLIVVLWPYFSYFGLDQIDLGGIKVFGTIVFSCLVFTVQYRVMLITITWTSVTAIVLAISTLSFFSFLLTYGLLYDLSWEFYYVPYKMFGSAIYWVVLLGVPATALYFDFVFLWIAREFFPSITDFAIEADYIMHKHNKDGLMNNLANKVKGEAVVERKIVENDQIEDIEIKNYKSSTAQTKTTSESKSINVSPHGFAFSHPGVEHAQLAKSMTAARKPKVNGDKKLPRSEKTGSERDIKLDIGGKMEMKRGAMTDTKLNKNRPLDESSWCGRFLQQKLPRLQKPLTPRVTIIVLTSVGCFFLLLGGLVLMGSQASAYQLIQYDGDESVYNGLGYTMEYEDCSLRASRNQSYRTCNVSITLEDDMTAPVHVHYGLSNFFQNYQSYATDRYPSQLDGRTKDPSSLYCKYYNRDYETDQKYLPCGLQAHSVFNDTFKLLNPELTMSETEISWKVDRERRYSNPISYPEMCGDETSCLYQWYPDVLDPDLGVKDEHFMVWLRISALSTFMKRYGRIDSDLKKGDTLNFEITARFVVETFEGGKALIVSSDAWIGGRNDFLGVAYLAVGCVVLLTVLVMLLKESACPRKIGNAELLVDKAHEVQERNDGKDKPQHHVELNNTGRDEKSDGMKTSL
ncbi:hypothetical protein AAMO2058_001215800 [Amorphochlora amoebiformis]